MKFTINYDLPTLNEYTANNRTNRYKGGAVKKTATNTCAFLAKEQGVKLDNCLYDISITWYQKTRKKDPDNVYFGVKFILDGLVKAGILANDGQKNIRDISHKLRRDKMHPSNYCVVEFKQAEEIKRYINQYK